MNQNKVYAIIPARSGSKGVPDKNIKSLAGKPLLSYSINFARKINADRVFCSTDSEQYAEIAKSYGAEVPFLRSEFASADDAMEHHVLQDLHKKFNKYNIPLPDILVWLRPTFVFRDENAVNQAIQILKDNSKYTAARTVVETEGRLYRIDDETAILKPNFEDDGKSMIRRQDVGKFYKVFSTDIIRFSKDNLDEDFLGRQVYPIVVDKICGMDIDDQRDFEIVEALIKNAKNLVNDYL